MKQLVGLLIAAGGLLSACGGPEKMENAVVKGEFKSLGNDTVYLYAKDFKEPEPDTIALDSAGMFKATLDISEPSFYRLRSSRNMQEFYMRPGDTLVIKGMEEARFAGSLAPEARMLHDLDEWKEKNSPDFYKLYARIPKNFIEEIDSIRSKEKRMINRLENHYSGADKRFVNLLHAAADYEWGSHLLNYPGYYEYVTGKKADVPDNFFANLKELELSAPQNIILKEYTTFLRDYSSAMASKKLPEEVPIRKKAQLKLEKTINVIKTKINDPVVKEVAYFNRLYGFMTYSGINGVAPYVEEFRNIAEDKDLKKRITKRYNDLKHLEKGKPAPGFKGRTIKGKEVALSDLQGNYVYVDVWATWCKPCLKEIPTLKKLEEEYSDKGVTFVSISIDRNKEKWKSMVKDRELKGIQIYTKDAWDSNIVERYGIKGIPRFILIDPDGNIVDAYAPRPSKGIDEIFDRLLKSEV